MPGGKGKGREQKMIFHFDQLLRDYRGSFEVIDRSTEKWRLLGELSLERQLLHYMLAFIIVVWFVVGIILGWETWTVTLIVGISLIGYVVALVTFKNKEEGRRTGPGVYRKYRIGMADTVDRVYQALDAEDEGFDVFGVTLTDWP